MFSKPQPGSTATLLLCLIAAGPLWLAGCASTPAAPASAAPSSYAFWPPPPSEPRIQFLRSFSVSTDVAPIKQSALDKAIFGSEPETALEIQKPYGVAMRDGRIYVCDTRNARVMVLDVPRRQTRLMGTSGPMALQAPIDAAIADDGVIYVVDRGRGIVVFTPDERPVQIFTAPQIRPLAVAVHAQQLYVSDMSSQSVLVMDRRTGEVLESIGTVGDDDGQFRLPLGVAVDRRGDLHVVDVMRCRLQKFSGRNRSVMAAVGEPTDAAGNFVRPKHVAVDADGLVYVVDSAFENVQVFDVMDGSFRLLTSFGGPGWHPGAMSLPAGICVVEGGVEHFREQIHPDFQAQRLIIVTNQFGPHKVAVYALGQLRPGKSVADVQGSMVELFPDTLEPGERNPFSELAQPSEDQPDEAAAAPTAPAGGGH